jgi:zona occludens toxin
MPIKIVSGLQGHGKTYETVQRVIVPAVGAGRRVVTNIAGLDRDAIIDYLAGQGTSEPVQGWGAILVVSAKEIQADDFFPVLDAAGEHWDQGVPSLVLPGDVVVVDEAWRMFGDTFIDYQGRGAEKRPSRAFAFMREHRHFIEPTTGVVCDLVFITQDALDLHRRIRSVVELTTLARKPKELGITSAYVVDLYQGGRPMEARKISSHRYVYDKAIFPLYKSYSGTGQGQEKTLDSRQNVLRKVLPMMLLAISAGPLVAWYGWHKLSAGVTSKAEEKSDGNAGPKGEAVSAGAGVGSAGVGGAGAKPEPGSGGNPGGAGGSGSVASPAKSGFRLVGRVGTPGASVWLLETSDGRTRWVDAPEAMRQTVHAMALAVDGEVVVPWRGGKVMAASGGIMGLGK